MSHINIEIKARCDDPGRVRETLLANNARFKGLDHQIDTYFRCTNGRLKLRQGNIENNLIHYHRDNTVGPKQSDVTLFKTSPESNLLELLAAAIGVLVVVDKKREIYFIDNVKFHIDTVAGLGSFVEIEAIDCDSELEPAALREQCERYMELLDIKPDDLVDCSYSDMLLAGQAGLSGADKQVE